MASWQGFAGLNRGYVLEQYERFRRDPSSVDPDTRAIFERWTPPAEIVEELPTDAGTLRKVVEAVYLAQAIRRYGHLAAQLDPLGARPVGDPSLLPETHNLTDEDLRQLPATLVSSPLVTESATMLDVVEALRRVYCSPTVYHSAHMYTRY
jgi:2-oxoglutarate dehydrogenase E1 component